MSQERSATVTKVTRDGKVFWRKQNKDAAITDLEYRIYAALSDDEYFFLEAPLPLVEKDTDSTVLYVEDLGTSFADALHQGRREDLSSPAYLMRSIKMRSGVNSIINKTLTLEDKQYLLETQRAALRASIERLSCAPVSDADLTAHYWSYRLLHAVGKYSEEIRDAYTALIGKKIDALMPLYGQWNADNCLRNNAISETGIVVIPFDFNSIRYELRQMDEASMVSLYILNGPLGSSAGNVISSTLGWLHKRFSFETKNPGTTKEYEQAYMLGSIHKHMMLSGYRTQEMRDIYTELDKHLSKHGWISQDKYTEFRKAFDEVEYHQSFWQQSLEACPDLITSPQDYEHANSIGSFVSSHTRLERTKLMCSDVFAAGERILYRR